MRHRSYCEFHLGDSLIHLHFLRNLALQNPEHSFIHAVHECHIPELAPAVEFCQNLCLVAMEGLDLTGWRNVWKNAGGFWERHRDRHRFGHFYVEWFKYLAKEMGLKSPFDKHEDLLFDYRAITSSPHRGVEPFDFLVCNSPPCSGQLKSYDGPGYFEPLVRLMIQHGKFVILTDPIPNVNAPCTRDWKCSITDIGSISMRAKAVVGIANGPMWPCLNVWNMERLFFVIMDHVLGDEYVTDLKPNITQVRTMSELMKAIADKGFL